MNLNLFKNLLLLFITTLLVAACGSQEDKASNSNLDPKIQKLKLQPGFKAEHLYNPSGNDMGSWVSMAFDPKGRLIVSDQYGTLYRMEIPPIGAASVTPTIEKLKIQTSDPVADSVIQMGYAQGLLYAHNSLYVMINHRSNDDFEKGSGMYRLQDLDNDDQFDSITLLKELNGAGEHGPHSIILGPDGNSLYVVAGNHTDLPEMDAYRQPKVWQNDNLYPEYKDPRGHAKDRGAPGGWIAKTDAEGKHWEVISSGFRNPYDIAFNQQGDLFTYDSDMEWDIGLPWYRPTRICHVTSGSEFGWRTGDGKWSPAYPDNLPPVLNIGQGSPTGVLHGKDAKFPNAYKDVLFAFDWSFGIVYAIHLKPEGSSYSGTKEEFVSGIPLPLTDGVIGPDGAMYFMTGGRRLDSDLYRVYYDGTDNTEYTASQETEEHKIREQLEQYHGDPKDGAIDFAWPYLSHDDRFVQYAARIAVEHQPVQSWKNKALQEKNPAALSQGIIALARHGNQAQRDQMLIALTNINYDELSERDKVDLLRAFEVTLYRFGLPANNMKKKVSDYLYAQFPAQNDIINFSLCKTLAYLEAPGMIDKTLTLLETEVTDDAASLTTNATDASDLILRNLQYGLDIAKTLSNTPPAQHTYYAIALSEVKNGWTPELRERYFGWFKKAFGFEAGNSYVGFINNARKAALANVPEDKFAYYNELSGNDLLAESGNNLAGEFNPKGPGKRWSEEDVDPLLSDGLGDRDFENGKNMFLASNCAACHTMNGKGGSSGPDLTQLGTRFSPADMLSSIIEPSKVISDQYASSILSLKDGSSAVGRILDVTDQGYIISQNPFAPDQTKEFPKDQVIKIEESPVSAMPPGMINRLNEDELKDLIAYLIAGGDENNPVYKSNN